MQIKHKPIDIQDLPAGNNLVRQKNIIAKFIKDCLAHQLFPGSLFPIPPNDINWNLLYRELSRQRLTGFFCALGKSQKDVWNAQFYEQLRADRYSLQFYGDQSSAQSRGVLSALEKANVKCIVLKGWAYIQTVYGGDHSLRVCEDIDILVQPEDVDRVEAILEMEGCEKDAESWQGYARQYMNAERYFFTAQPNGVQSKFSIGLHWGLLHIPAYDKNRIDVNSLFQRAQPLQLFGGNALQLSVEEHIVYACAHQVLHHRFDSALFRYYELSATLLKEKVNWELVSKLAVQWQCLIPLQVTLRQVNMLWGEVVPLQVLNELELVRPNLMEVFIARWIKLFRGKDTFDHLLTWFTFPDWKQRVVIVFKDVFPSPAYMQKRYGKAPLGFVPFLYLVRFVHAITSFFN